jgi:hypothetical protein
MLYSSFTDGKNNKEAVEMQCCGAHPSVLPTHFPHVHMELAVCLFHSLLPTAIIIDRKLLFILAPKISLKISGMIGII